MNKYEKWYAAITRNAKNRVTDEYIETHHIQPRSLGGTDDKENLVDVTAREHFVCHWLLTKMYVGESRAKMLYALNGMKRNSEHQERYETKITSRVYARIKQLVAEQHSEMMKGKVPPNKGKPMDEAQKEKIRETKRLNPYKPTAEQKANQVKAQTGKKHKQSTKDKIRDKLKGVPKGPMSETEKAKRSTALLGKSKTQSHASNVRNAVLGNTSINKDGVEKKVKKDELQNWLDQGWQPGGRKRKEKK